nr:MAG TPA: B-ZIP transcription factor [Caudoviricetes sp.]
MVVGVKIGEAKKIAKKYESLGYVYIKSEIVDNEYMKLIFQDPIASEENNITDIQFHKGDFVENKDGKIGYISSICHCDECKKRGFFEPTITYLDGTIDYISNYSVKTVTSDYKQIGIQKFSKEDELRNRIAALEKENKELKEEVDNLTIQRNHAVDLCCFYEMERNGIKQ